MIYNPDSKVHGDNMGPIWGRQDPGGPHAGPINFAIWECKHDCINKTLIDRRNIESSFFSKYIDLIAEII